MASTSRGRRRPSNVRPELIRAFLLASWCWVAAVVVLAIVYSALQAPRLSAVTWVFLPPGKGESGPGTALRFGTTDLIFLSWITVAVFAGIVLLGQLLTRPNRVWPLIVVILVNVGCAVVLADLVFGAIPQIGFTPPPDPESAPVLLIAPWGGTASWVTSMLTLLTAIVLPGLLMRSFKLSNMRSR